MYARKTKHCARAQAADEAVRSSGTNVCIGWGQWISHLRLNACQNLINLFLTFASACVFECVCVLLIHADDSQLSPSERSYADLVKIETCGASESANTHSPPQRLPGAVAIWRDLIPNSHIRTHSNSRTCVVVVVVFETNELGRKIDRIASCAAAHTCLYHNFRCCFFFASFILLPNRKWCYSTWMTRPEWEKRANESARACPVK